jgi:hypothetical protein
MICPSCGVTMVESPIITPKLGILRAYAHPGNLHEVCSGPDQRPAVWKIFAAYDHYVDTTNCEEGPGTCFCVDSFEGWLSWQDVL